MKTIIAYFFSLALVSNAIAGTPCVNKIVYGFQNFADGCTNKYQTVDWSLITHFAFSSVSFDSNGNLIPNSGCYNPSSGLVNMAHANGVKVIIMIWSPGNTATVDNVLASSSKMQTMANSIKSYIQTYNLDGVNIDFENIPITNSIDAQPNKAKVTALSQVIFSTLKTANPNYHVAWSTPYTKECQFIKPVWDFTAMAPYVDAFTIMSYNYIAGNTGWTGSHQPFSAGPQYGSTYGSSANKLYYNFQNTVTEYLASGVPASKIVMGEGFYGFQWSNLNSGIPGVMGASGGIMLNYNVMAVSANTNGSQWYNAEQTNYYAYQNGGWVQGFYDCDSTLGIKLDYINTNNLGGVMIWALHYDSGHVELWDKIQQKLCTSTDVNENSSNNVFSVFPNPMNELSLIYSDWKNCAINIIDVAGNVVKKIPNVNQFPFTIEKENLSSGIYILELRSEDKIERTKLIVE